MKLATVKVANWSEFAKKHGINLICDCGRQGCEYCNNRGMVWPTSDTAFDSGYEVAGKFPRVPYPHTVAFEFEHRIWLAFTGDDEERGPFLGMAWVSLFPRCEWLPEQFGDANSVPDYYAALPREDADRLVERLRQSLLLDLSRSTNALEQLRKFEGQHHN